MQLQIVERPFATVFQILGSRKSSEPVELSKPARVLLIAASLVAAIALSGLWGLAATSTSLAAAGGNVVKVPILILGSGLAAIPLVVVLWKLVGPPQSSVTSLLLAYAVALFGGALLLAVTAPIVAIYQYSSSFAGPSIAHLSAVVAFVGFALLFVRALRRVSQPGTSKWKLAMPATALLVVQMLAMAQLASATSPVFKERTWFGRGVDGMAVPSQVDAP